MSAVPRIGELAADATARATAIYPPAMAGGDLQGALKVLSDFLKPGSLTQTIAHLEHSLEGRTKSDVADVLQTYGVSRDVLVAADVVRTELGRISDVIHATAIALTLPHVLEAGEVLKRPSLAAGNDPSRPYDLETDRRVGEFKLARWQGADAMRKRQLVKDLVQLAADSSGRRRELYVVGARPLHFLMTSTSTVAWALDRFPSTDALFRQHFGHTDVPIHQFVTGQGACVEVIDLEIRLPQLFGPDSV